MSGSHQLVLDLPLRPAMGRDDFLVAPSNAAAVALIDSWPQWPAYGAILVGPEGAGKSHLAQVWQARSGAVLMPLQDLSVERAADALAGQALALEHGGGGIDEKALFHALNLARQKSAHVLITAAQGPEGWGLQLPDLISRLKALPVIPILPPDDVLLRNVLVKLFADRQIHVDDSVVGYLLLRMPRSLAAARQVVALIDQRALAEKAEVTRPFVAKVLAETQNPDLFTP